MSKVILTGDQNNLNDQTNNSQFWFCLRVYLP
jgi:hypothetical protein